MIGIRLWQVAGWTMLHYFWVGAALASIALVARRRLRSSAAAVRYLVALGSLALLSVAPGAIAVVVMQNVAPAPHTVPPIDPVPPFGSASQPEAPPLDELRPTMAAADAPLPAAVADEPVRARETRYGERALAVLDVAATWLPWLWVCGAPLSLLLTTVGLLGAERLRRQSRPLEDARIVELCRQLAEALKISCRVSVAICDRIAAPVLVGVLRPMILLPAAALAGWDPQQLEMVLWHELAHVRRCDNLVNLLQRIVESLLFFHPMLWVVSGWVRHEREHCCDELVVARTRQPRAYAEMLVDLSERVSRNAPRSSSLAHPQAVSSMAQRSLVARVRRILKKEEQSMQVSRKAVALAFAGLLALAMMIGGYCSLSSRAEDAPSATVETQGKSDPKSNPASEADSRAWYLLSQADSNGLLLGLPERLGKTIVAPSRQGPMWKGVEDGGSLALDVQVEGDAKGEIFVGFFADPRWWLAEPVQVRRVPGPGRYTFDRLIPGKYQLGAMLGAPSKPDALGVHATWPAPVEITKGRHAAEARLLVSTKFKDRPVALPVLEEGSAGQPAKMDATRMITVRTVDSAGKPVPFCHVTFVDRGSGTETVSFHEARTDDQGRAYCDKIKRAFSLCVQRFDFMPGRLLATRYEYRKLAKIYHAQDRPTITIKWDQFPAGTARVVGQVHDQNKQPLKEYFLTLTRWVGERHDWSDATSYGVSLPVIQPDGRFEVADLPPGTYTVMVRAFDYSAYVWTFDGPKVTIPDEPHAVVQLDVEVEAKELFYGRAVYQDGTPVSRGSWTTWFKRDIHNVWGGEAFSWGLEKDGAFRVPLSREERRRLTANSKGMVEVSAYAPKAEVQVPFSQLSKDPARPLKVVVPKRGTAGDSRDSPAASPEPSAPTANEPSGKTSAGEKQPAEANSAVPGMKSPFHFSVVIARHVMLLDGKQVVTWPQIEEKIAKRPNPSQTHPDFYITRGAEEAGRDESAQREIWRLHRDYKLAGHSEGSLWPRADLRYDRVRTPLDLKPDESLRIDGKVERDKDKPVAGAEIILVTPVDASIAYKTYEVALVKGRVRNPLEEVMTSTNENGQFTLYPPKDQGYFLIALHPDGGIGFAGKSQFARDHKIHLLDWAGLITEFSEDPERQTASLRTRITQSGDIPEIVFSEYGSDLRKEQATRRFSFTHVPPIFETAISRDFPGKNGVSYSLSGASVNLHPGETRRLDLGPLTEQQRHYLGQLRRDSEERQKKAMPVERGKELPRQAKPPVPAEVDRAMLMDGTGPFPSLDLNFNR